MFTEKEYTFFKPFHVKWLTQNEMNILCFVMASTQFDGFYVYNAYLLKSTS